VTHEVFEQTNVGVEEEEPFGSFEEIFF